MKIRNTARHASQILLAIAFLVFVAKFFANSSPQSPPNIDVDGYLSVDKMQRGRAEPATVVMHIPSGFHVNSSRPLEKFLVATQLQIEAPKGIVVGQVIYPRALLKNLKFSKNKVSVYEGRVAMRFNVTVPASFGSEPVELKARLRYQSCNDEVCFPPRTREVTIPIRIAGK